MFCGVGRPSDTHLNWSIAGAAHFGHSQTISARQKEVPPHIPSPLSLPPAVSVNDAAGGGAAAATAASAAVAGFIALKALCTVMHQKLS